MGSNPAERTTVLTRAVYSKLLRLFIASAEQLRAKHNETHEVGVPQEAHLTLLRP